MHLVVDRANLLGELRLVAGAAVTQSTAPRLGRLCLEAQPDGVVQLTAQNMYFGLTATVEADVREGGGIYLPAKSFLRLVQTLDGEITVRTDRNDCATITAGCSRSRMPGEPIDDLARLQLMPEGATRLAAEALLRLVSRVSFAIAKQESQFSINGSLMRFTGDRVVCVGTDGHRLSVAWAPAVTAVPLEFVLPFGAMESIQDLVADQEQVCLAASASHIFVGAGPRLLVALKSAGTFPDYNRILVETATSPAEMDAGALRSALARVLLFADRDSRPKVRFRLRPGALQLSAANANGGEGEHSLECTYVGPEVGISFNGRYIQEFLDVVRDGNVCAWFSDAKGKPAEWRVVGDDAYRHLVSPMWEEAVCDSHEKRTRA